MPFPLGKQQSVRINTGQVELEGNLALPPDAHGVVLFAHGSGSSRFSPRNNFVAAGLFDAGIASLLIDLLTPDEDADYDTRFDIALLTTRLIAATRWLQQNAVTKSLHIGYFGASTGAAAALEAAAELGREIGAVVSRGGRPDLASERSLRKVTAPTLLIVGGWDDVVIGLNEQAYACLSCEKKLVIIPGATHLFEEPGTLQQVTQQAAAWFKHNLG